MQYYSPLTRIRVARHTLRARGLSIVSFTVSEAFAEALIDDVKKLNKDSETYVFDVVKTDPPEIVGMVGCTIIVDKTLDRDFVICIEEPKVIDG